MTQAPPNEEHDEPLAAPIGVERIMSFAIDVGRSLGLTEDDGHLLADTLIKADLWGHQSHGMMRLSWYAARIKSGATRKSVAPELVVDGGAIAVLDGHDGIGQKIAQAAMTEAIARAKQHGIGAVAARNSGHFGTAMYYTRLAAAENCIGILTTNASPAMAPWGARKKMVGTNPWSIAAPAGVRDPMVLDIANTAVARGKLYLARKKGMEISQGWAMDLSGVPTTDPRDGIEGLILPMAGHKGYGIALMMDVLSGVMSGSNFGSAVHGPYEPNATSGCGHMAIALDIAAFRSVADFDGDMEALIRELKTAPLAQGFSEVFYPGELEAKAEVANRREGIRYPQETLRELERLAQELQVQPLT
jgi:LDH2 family malate/lactate/ureidoglycolate dehydrogenase